MAEQNHTIENRKCSIPNCEREHAARNLCKTHYKTHRRRTAVIAPREDIEKAFWRKVPKNLPFIECWMWQGSLEKDGYGRLEVKYKKYRAHQVSFYLHNGNWAKQWVLHSCDNRFCVNPFHLRDGSHQDNMQDGVDRNRFPKGSKNSNSKLNEQQVKEIKQALAHRVLSYNALAKKYQISRSTVYQIRAEKTWKQIKV